MKLAKKQTKLTEERKHLKWQMSHIHTLESRVETDQDFARFMGRFAGESVIKIDIDKAAEIFGGYFTDFWTTYTATDVMGAEMAVSSFKKIKGGEYKESITKPELLAKGLEGAVNYLVEGGEEGRFSGFELICDYALKLKDSQLVERISKLIGDCNNLNYNELRKIADKTKNTYLLNKAGEAMIRQAGKVGQAMLEQGESLSRLDSYKDVSQQNSAEESAASQVKSERMSIDFAASVYRKAWKSACYIKNDINSKTHKLSKTFMKEKYDDLKLMKRALGKLTGYRGKELADFEVKVYSTLNRIFDWNHYSRWIEDYKKSEARRK